MFSYVGFGLGLRSALPLPELLAGEAIPEVEIRLGRVRPAVQPVDSDFGFTLAPEEVRLFWKMAGTFLVRGGREIIIDPAPGVDEYVLRHFLLGPVLAVLLHQRRCLVLHASCTGTHAGAVAFLGWPGWGKSAMAATLHARGYAFLTDDLLPVLVQGGRICCSPGSLQIKLWPDVAEFLGHKACPAPSAQPLAKEAFRVSDRVVNRPLPLMRLYVLADGTHPAVEPLGPQEAFVELVRHSYGARLLWPHRAPSHFRQCAALAGQVPVRRLRRPRALAALPEVVRCLEADLGQPAA